MQMYDSSESDLKLNDVFEFVGIFTFDPDLALTRDDTDELMNDFCEDTLVCLPPSKVLCYIVLHYLAVIVSAIMIVHILQFL